MVFTCHLCGFQFYLRDSLTKHIRTKHEGRTKPKFSCSGCNKSFFERYLLKRHFSRIHSNPQPPSTTTPGSSSSSLLPATLSTSGQCPPPPPPQYQCTDCGKTYGWHYDLKRHLKSHAAGSRICSYCGTKFKTNPDLTSHLRFVCSAFKQRCSEEAIDQKKSYTLSNVSAQETNLKDHFYVDCSSETPSTSGRGHVPMPADCSNMSQSTPGTEHGPVPADCPNMTQSTSGGGYVPGPADCPNMTQSTSGGGYGPVPADCSQSTSGGGYVSVPVDCSNVPEQPQNTSGGGHRKYPCCVCGRQFTKPYKLRSHTRAMHEGQPSLFNGSILRISSTKLKNQVKSISVKRILKLQLF